MSYQPADSLKNRTFIGLIVAQFLAGFNDQAIHAAAMFYAIHQEFLSQDWAISLMPILFYAPWAIFCTLAGHFADRYSKTKALVVWKCFEIVVSIILLGGFVLGSVFHSIWGPFLVLMTVFLMGTHAAFFAPAKYGAMPEILQPHLLSRGNGILESSTFLAAILGTVSGGLLTYLFHDLIPNQEYWIGVILLVLSIIGAVASLMIAQLPAASPGKRLPKNIFKPLMDNLGVLWKARPLALSVLGIAFFIFMVSYMRATMYMHGESRNPRWNEFQTSLVVATVALGVGFGAPFAGYLSGGKVELGLVPLGCLGMIGAIVLASLQIDHTIVLVVALVIIGFFSGFYMVPLYTLLQHRAPKTSKGDLVATSNFINVVGAMAASGLFFVLVQGSHRVGLSPEVAQQDKEAVGKLIRLQKDKQGHPTEIVIRTQDDDERIFLARSARPPLELDDDILAFIRQIQFEEEVIVQFDDNFFEMFGAGVRINDEVIVSKYELRKVVHYLIRPENQPMKRVYDNERLPSFLFFGAAAMTLGILILLWRKLPDFFVRTAFWLRSLGKYGPKTTNRLKAVNMERLPMHGPVILATNCDRLESSLQLVSVTDRSTLFVLWENPVGREAAPWLRRLARRHSIVEISHAGNDAWRHAHECAKAELRAGNLLAVTADGHAGAEIEDLLKDLQQATAAPIVPVYCGSINGVGSGVPRVRVVFGTPVKAGATLEEIRQEIRNLGEWIRQNDDVAGAAHEINGMRIAHFIQRYPPALGGSEAYFARLSRFLVCKGDHVSVFTSNALDLEAFWSRNAAVVPAGATVEDGVAVHRYPLLRWPGRRYLLKALSLIPHRLWQCLTLPCNPFCLGMWRDAGRAETPFDIVHAAAFPYAWPIVCARRLARRLHVPFLITPFLHLGDPADAADVTRRQYLAPPFAWLLRDADGIFVQTPSERDAVLGLGIAPVKVILQGLGVDPAECTGGDRAAVRRRLGVNESDVVIGHLANQSREKGTIDLLLAVEMMWQRGVAAQMVLAGPEMANFRAFWPGFQRGLSPELRKRIHRLGVLDDLQKRDFFAGLDVFALPSRSDSFGLVLLEAWANAKPVAAYRAGGIADLVRHKQDGLLAPCGDLQALAHVLEELCQTDAQRREMGESGRVRVESEFRWPEKLKLVRDSYNAIMVRVTALERA